MIIIFDHLSSASLAGSAGSSFLNFPGSRQLTGDEIGKWLIYHESQRHNPGDPDSIPPPGKFYLCTHHDLSHLRDQFTGMAH